MTMADLEQFAPRWKDPIAVAYRGRSVHVPPPPCEGFQFLLTLRILEGFDLAKLERNGVEHLDTVYRAIRLAAGVRIANNNPSPDKLARLLADDHVEKLRARVRDGRPIAGPDRAVDRAAGGRRGPRPHHLVLHRRPRRQSRLRHPEPRQPVRQRRRGAGHGRVPQQFPLLGRGDAEEPQPHQARRRAGDVHVAQHLDLDGRPVLALGTPGSYGILQTQVQALVQYLDFALPLQEAIEAPRARLWDGRLIQVEGRVPAATIAALKERGHGIEAFLPWTMKVGGIQAVAVDPATGVMTGAADPRRDSYAVAL